MSGHGGFTNRVMDFFRDRPSCWINAVDLEPVGGRQAWRSRVAEARLNFEAAGEGTIKNRQRREVSHGRRFTVSEYAFFPASEAPRETAPFHDLNEWSLR